MRLDYLLGLSLILGCKIQVDKVQIVEQNTDASVIDTISYDHLKMNVSAKRKLLYKEIFNLNDQKNINVLQNYWINTLLHDFYPKWANTPGKVRTPNIGFPRTSTH